MKMTVLSHLRETDSSAIVAETRRKRSPVVAGRQDKEMQRERNELNRMGYYLYSW